MAVPTKGSNSSGDYQRNNGALYSNLSSYQDESSEARKGYPPSIFRDKVPNEYLCNLCRKVLCKPMVSGCGCRFCALCITDFLLTVTNPLKTRCPQCDGDLDPAELQRDPFARKFLQKQEVFCENEGKGCKEINRLEFLQQHLELCEYRDIACEMGCGAMLVKTELAAHMANECPRRSLPCHLCQQLVGQTELELENHLKNDCPEGNVECYFKVWGCDYTGPRKSLNEHLKAKVDYHYGTVGTEVAKLKTVVTELQETAQDLTNGASASPSSEGVAETVDKLNERMKKLQLTMVQKFDKIGKLEKAAEQTAKKTDVQKEATRIDTIASQTTSLTNRIQKLEEKSGQGLRARKGGATQQSLEQRVSTLENQISLHAMRLAEHDVRFQVHGTTSYNGSLVWKIKDYARRKRDADSGKTLSLYSQPFFSSRYGFKMCARVYLNGDGIGKDSHMSLFFVIMKGDYDSLLSWPFKQKVTLMLLDQGGSQRHLSDSFRPDPTSSSFQKPTAEMNIASGCPLFVSQDVFANSSCYLTEDTIFLKIVVDTADLTPL